MTFQLVAATSGYRGDTLTEITPEAAWRIGNVYVDILNGDLADKKRVPLKYDRWRIALAWDTRHGAELLAHAASLGIRQAGAHVLSIGIATTGVLSNFVQQQQCDGAIFVTGSHMPHTRVGIILMNTDGTYCTADITDRVTQLINVDPFVPYTCALDEIGLLQDMEDEDAEKGHGAYLDRLRAHESLSALRSLCIHRIREQPLWSRVLVDTGNGPAGRVAGPLLREFGFDAIELYLEERPVPERESEVSPRACAMALKETMKYGCRLGVCFDTDADRVLFIDERGEPVEDDIVAAIFAKDTLQRGDHVVTPYNCAPLIERICAELGATIQFCEIGQPDTGRAVKEQDAAFAYEASAGKFMWPKIFLWYDAVYAMLRMLEIMLRRGIKLSQLVAEFPPVFRINRKVDLRAMAPDAVPAAIQRACDKAAAHFQRIDQEARGRTDLRASDCLVEKRWFGRALRLTFQDGSRLLLRASGTEPIARSYGIADTKARAEDLATVGEECLRQSLQS